MSKSPTTVEVTIWEEKARIAQATGQQMPYEVLFTVLQLAHQGLLIQEAQAELLAMKDRQIELLQALLTETCRPS